MMSEIPEFSVSLRPEYLNDLYEVSQRRHALHVNHASSRPLSKDYEFIGLVGEAAFGMQFNLQVDLTDRPGGDNGTDFYTSMGNLDVKTALKPINLFREEGKAHAEKLILAGWDQTKRRVDFYGWEYEATIVEQCPVPKDFGYGIMNHHKHRSKLRSMGDFLGVFDMRELLYG